MGDLHNLFGRVTEVHVFLDEDEEIGWYIEETIEGSTIGQVLALTQWDKIELMRLVKLQVDAAIKSDRLKPNDAMKIARRLRARPAGLHLPVARWSRGSGERPASGRRST